MTIVENLKSFFKISGRRNACSNAPAQFATACKRPQSAVQTSIGLFTVSPLELAAGYAIAAVISVGSGGALSMQIRTILLEAGNNQEAYYAMVTYHALLMIFGWVMPLLFGVVANALLPSMVGVSDLVLPRLNSAGLWFLLDAVILLTLSQAIPSPIGWTVYPPLSALENAGVDWAIISLHVAGISSIALAINLLTTTYVTYQMRMPWRSISLVMWATNVANVLLIVTLPALAAGITMLLLDRRANSGFYSIDHSGDPILYQHLFWFFGHPEVYVLVLPAFGYTSHLFMYESHGTVVNYSAMIVALLTIGSVSMVVYGHHLYTTGLAVDDRMYYTLATFLIAIPTGVKYFTWISTMNLSSHEHSLTNAACYGFMWFFAIGGLTGVVLADGALDQPLHDAYYVVAHFHLVMAVAIMYSAFGMLMAESSLIWG